MKNHWILLVLIVVGCVFLSGCAEQSGEGFFGGTPTTTPSPTPTPKIKKLDWIDEPDFKLSDSGNYYYTTGEVKNSGTEVLNSVKLKFKFYDGDDQLLHTETIYTDPRTIDPGETATYDLMVNESMIAGYTHHKYSWSWT